MRTGDKKCPFWLVQCSENVSAQTPRWTGIYYNYKHMCADEEHLYVLDPLCLATIWRDTVIGCVSTFVRMEQDKVWITAFLASQLILQSSLSVTAQIPEPVSTPMPMSRTLTKANVSTLINRTSLGRNEVRHF